MSVLSGFPRSRLPDYDDNLMFSVLSGELATLWALVPWVLLALTNKGQHTTHQFIEFIHLLIHWQLFSSLEYFVISIRMQQASERVFVATLLSVGHQQQYYYVEKSKIGTYNGPSNLVCCRFSWHEAE